MGLRKLRQTFGFLREINYRLIIPVLIAFLMLTGLFQNCSKVKFEQAPLKSQAYSVSAVFAKITAIGANLDNVMAIGGADSRVYQGSPPGPLYQMHVESLTSIDLHPFPTSVVEPAIDIATAQNTTCAVFKSGSVYCQGSNQDGQVGHVGQCTSVNEGANRVPIPSPVSLIMAETEFFCAITNNGQIYCWGLDRNHVISSAGTGISPTTSGCVESSVPSPQHLDRIPGKAINISMSTETPASAHACAITEVAGQNKIYCWGGNQFGQSGQPLSTVVASPTEVTLPEGEIPSQVMVGYQHTCTLSQSGKVYCFGDNSYLQLGLAATSGSASPRLIDLSQTLRGRRIISVLAYASRSCIFTDDGELICWGRSYLHDAANFVPCDPAHGFPLDPAGTCPVMRDVDAAHPLSISTGLAQVDRTTKCVVTLEGEHKCIHWWNNHVSVGLNFLGN